MDLTKFSPSASFCMIIHGKGEAREEHSSRATACKLNGKKASKLAAKVYQDLAVLGLHEDCNLSHISNNLVTEIFKQ